MPFKNKEDYNKYRKAYRLKAEQEGKCKRCYRNLIEDSGNKYCVNCSESGTLRSKLSVNFMGDN